METPTFLYKPNFCAECGEKIDRESWHFWTSRSFCENCEPVYRANRIVPAALLGIALFVTGMFFGQTGQKPPKAAPVVSTLSAAGIEKAPPAAPKQLAAPGGQSQMQNSAVNQATAENPRPLAPLAPLAGAKQPAAGNFPAPETPAAVYTCGARTQKGTPCSRRVKTAGSRCWQHLGKPAMREQ